MSDKPEKPASKKPGTEMPAPAANVLATALANAPEEVREAFGGDPVAMPPRGPRPGGAPAPRAGARGIAPTVGAIAVPERLANPLFDAPSRRLEKARQGIRNLRAALGAAAQAMQSAASLLEATTAAYGDTLAEVAALEGFDLQAATAVCSEFEDFLDRHKPKAPQAEPAA